MCKSILLTLYLYFLSIFTFVIIQSMCSDAAPSNQNISHSNESGRGNHSTGTFYSGKYSKVGAAEAYYLELLSEWRDIWSQFMKNIYK